MKKNLTSGQRAWLCVVGAFLIATGTGMDAALSLFYLPVTAELGFEQAPFSLYISIMGICGVVTMPLVGTLVSRYANKVKLLGILSALLGLVCYGWLAMSSKLYQFYIGGVILSFVMPVASNVLGYSVIAHWFAKKRSVAIAVVSIGCSVGMVLYAQVVRLVIDAMGWRAGYLSVGLLIMVLTVVGSLMLSAPPERYGMKPYGWDGSKNEATIHGMTLGKALKSSPFWLMAFATFFSGAYISGMQQSLVPTLQVDFFLSASVAASLMSIYSIVCAAAKPLVGIVYERGGVKTTIAGTGLMLAISMIMLNTTQGLVCGIIAMVFMGLGNMYATVILSSYIADLFGNRDYSSIFGYINIAFTLGVSVGPFIAGRSYDVSQGYHLAYYVFLGCVVVSVILTVLADNAARKHKSEPSTKAAA